MEARVLRYITQHPRCTRLDIQRGLGLSMTMINQAINVLTISGNIETNAFDLPNKFTAIKGVWMKFLTNTYNPKLPDAKMSLSVSFEDLLIPNGVENALQRHLEYLSDKIIVRPEATSFYTVEELKKMGMVGVYKNPTLSGKEVKKFIKDISELR